ncbi:incomplete iron reductase [Sparassis latifolia]
MVASTNVSLSFPSGLDLAAALSAATTTKSSSAPTSASLALDLDVIILGVVALFILFALPGAVTRSLHRSEWSEGHLFRSVVVKALRHSFVLNPKLSLAAPTYTGQSSRAEKGAFQSDESHTYTSHAHLVREPYSGGGRRRKLDPPAHMPSWSTMLPGVTSVFKIAIRPGLSVGKAMILAVYFGLVVGFGLYRSNPFVDFNQSAYIATSQIPVVIILAAKNNMLGAMMGYGYEKLNYLHRFAGYLFVLGVNVHAVGYFYKWSLAGTLLNDLADPTIAWGFAALLAADILVLFSFKFIRDKFFPFFLASHVICAVVLLVATYLHEQFLWPYIAVAAAYYGLDRIMRIVKTRYSTARLLVLSDLNMVRVEIPSINAGWRAGQHLRIRVLSTGMGWFGWAENHPFTIASVSRSPGEEGLVLLCKKAGDWTGRLVELAKRAEHSEACEVHTRVKVLVEGPYGGHGHAILPSYSGAMLVAGGSGITYALSTAQELMQKEAEGSSRVKVVELVWSVPDPVCLEPLLPLFSSMLAQAQSSTTSLRISVFYTRAPTSPDAFKAFHSLPQGLTLAPGRPRLSKILDSVMDRTISHVGKGHKCTGVALGVCGPLELAEEVTSTARSVHADKRQAVGGVEVHAEVF